MQPVSCARRRFPPEVVRHAARLCLRFRLSCRDVEELLAERGVEAGDETVRRRILKFGPVFARNLRRLRPGASDIWHLDEIMVSVPDSACSRGAPSTAGARSSICRSGPLSDARAP